jgi:branched-chain amino acid transport system substrate-binding protein
MRNVTPADPRRRAMLRAFGLAAAGAAAPSIAWGSAGALGAMPQVATLARARSDLRVAILLPGSQFDGMSAAAAAFRDGFTLAVDGTTARRMSVHVHDIGGGVSRAMAFARGQRIARDTDIVVAMMSARAAPWMQQDLAAAGIPLMVANAGERLVRSDAVSPSFVYSSLELASAAYASGRWAAEHAGRRCALACSYYESGFEMVPAFRAGFEAAGGTVVRSVVSGAPSGTIAAAAAARELSASDADVVAAFYTGDDAREFFAAYAALAPAERRVVVASPMVTADEAFGVELTSVASWSPALRVDANRNFVASFADRFCRVPDPFAMLGYETACMVRDSSPGGARSLADGLRRTGFAGTRGVVAMDDRTNEISTPLFLRRIDGSGEESLTELVAASTAAHLADALSEQGGWITSYMTV